MNSTGKVTRNDQGKWDVEGLDWRPVYEEICDNIREVKPFAFSRYGDGEWNAIKGKVGQNCDGHQYFDNMGARLRDIVKSNPGYMMGIQPLALRLWGDELINFNPNIDWVNSDALHNASIDERLEGFFEALEGKKVHIIAPEYLQSLDLEIKLALEISDKNCWLMYDGVRDYLKEHTKGQVGEIYLICASMMANVLIDDLWKMNPNNIYIDCGSVFDPYVGKITRSYHRNLFGSID